MKATASSTEAVPRVRTALVLGAGGTVGIAYHAGVMKALAEAGIDPAGADLVVGTSAGALAGSILRVGHDIDRVWDLAVSDQNPFVDDAPFFRPDVVFSQGWRTPAGLARRAVGSAYVAHRSVVRWPAVVPPMPLQRFYRGGLASVTELRSEFAQWAGEEWPAQPLQLCSFDLVTGRRIVLGEPGRSRPPLPDAMRAASAVPTLYPPVRLGRRLLVDGAVSSSTSLDVALTAGAEVIVVAAPLAYDPADRPPPHLRAVRELFHRVLERELRRAERAGATVLVIRPDADEARCHGLNFLRSSDPTRTAELAHARAEGLLRASSGRRFADAWRAASATSSAPGRAPTPRASLRQVQPTT